MNAQDCIQLVSESLEKINSISTEQRENFRKAIEAIKTRAGDPLFNIALIGDFSSGKSTFTNALIKKDILKTAWKATTAVPTQIYYHISDSTLVVVEMADGGSFRLDNQAQRTQLEDRLRVCLPKSDKDLVALLTTSSDYSDEIKQVKLYMSTHVGLKNICIIDTPGVNPGAADARSHVQVTRDVLRELADSAIVLFPATEVYTASFQQFLEENASHFMNDAVFVVTMLDIVDPGERESVVDFVRNNLKNHFHLESPTVYCCSAKYAFESSEKGSEWTKNFDELRHQLIDHLAQKRQKVLHDKLSALMKELLAQVDEEVQFGILLIEDALRVLDENSIDHLEQDMAKSYARTEDCIRDKFNQLDFSGEYARMFSNIKSRVGSGIRGCTKIQGKGSDSIPWYVKNCVPDIVDEEKEVLARSVNRKFKLLSEIGDQYVQESRELFSKYNLSLRNDRVKLPESISVSYESNIAVSSMDGASGMQDLLIGVGALTTIVAVVPLAIFDSIFDTDLAGGLDNLFEGVVNFFGSFGALERNKQRAIASLENSLTTSRDNSEEEFLAQMAENRNKLVSSLGGVQQELLEEYQKVYKVKYEEFLQKRTSLEKEIASYQDIHSRLENALNSI